MIDGNVEQIFERYLISIDKVHSDVIICQREKSFVKEYFVDFPKIGEGTEALIHNMKVSLLKEFSIPQGRLINENFVKAVKKELRGKAIDFLKEENPNMSKKDRDFLIGVLLHEMLGLGKIELLLSDHALEELVINKSGEPIWVYHKNHGWLKTNVVLSNEDDIQNYASIIARRVGKQITTLNPLLDASLPTGDRVNATLTPISNHGNTLTIRRFRRDPFTVIDLIENNTFSVDLMALLWEAIQYELNIVFSGGTASGKTTAMGICLPFIQPNHRLLSIEDTRELRAPDFLHWVPMVTRAPNPEGKGRVEMLDLLVNSLRMRPDRIIVGEIRRQAEAEVMFEAMHTGHSVFTTVHANTVAETIKRLTNPPINTPSTMLGQVHLNVVLFRNRQLGIRRVLQVGEFVLKGRGDGQELIEPNILFRWRGSDDKIVKENDSVKLMDELSLHTGMSKSQIMKEIKEKKDVLEWLISENIRSVNEVGKVVAQYYKDKNVLFDIMKNTSKKSTNKKN